MRKILRVRACSVAVFSLIALTWAAGASWAGGYYHKGTFMLGGGFNNPVGDASNFLKGSGSIFFAAGKNLTPKTAVQIEYQHNWFDVSQEVLDRAATDSTSFDNAHVSMWSICLNGIYRIHPEKDIVPWFTGGIGYYKRNIMLTQNALIYYPPIWDPWWGWIDGGWSPGEAISGQRSDSGAGFNVGLGLDLSIDSGASLFVDARYHRAYLDGVDVQMIPIMFGVRW